MSEYVTCNCCLGTGKLIKPIRPDPEWWAEARKLRREGLGWGTIAYRLNRPTESIRYACDATMRARTRERTLRNQRKRKAKA